MLTLDEPADQIGALSPARRKALIACFNAGGLYKSDGAWHGPAGGRPLSGTTVADLARDGMLTVRRDRQLGAAQLTERGQWFARALLDDEETSR
jgi:hypothetical protein